MVSRDVIWVTLESVRQDHTSLAGHSRETTPRLRALEADGVAFDRCFSHDIWTRSSTASILTGLAPSAHRTWSNDARLPETVETIPEAFRDAGYRTACVSPNGQISRSTGLDRGFDSFHYLNRSTLLSEAGIGTFLRWIVNLRRHSAGFTGSGNHCTGYLSTEIAKRHVDSAATDDRPLFLYLHHGDSHHPYVPPVAWRDRFEEDLPLPIDRAVTLAMEMSDRLHEYIAQDEPFTDEEWLALRVLYDTSVAYVDHLTGVLVEYARKQLDDPIVVVTADHGELFGEQGLLAHMLVTRTATTNVPLVVSGLDGVSDTGLVQHADVMQMVCNEIGVDHPVPLGRDIRKRPREIAITQRGGNRARNKLAKISSYNDAFPTERFPTDTLTSLRTDDWRYQTTGSESELFELPDESRDVADEHATVAARLHDYWESWIDESGHPVGKAGTAEFDTTVANQLRDLGYLQ